MHIKKTLIILVTMACYSAFGMEVRTVWDRLKANGITGFRTVTNCTQREPETITESNLKNENYYSYENLANTIIDIVLTAPIHDNSNNLMINDNLINKFLFKYTINSKKNDSAMITNLCYLGFGFISGALLASVLYLQLKK